MAEKDAGVGLKEEVASWSGASDKLRDVVKWIAASFGALGALLIGTAPLTALRTIRPGVELVPALVCGVLALACVGYIVWQATSLLTPKPLELQELAQPRFAEIRQRVAANPIYYLGSNGKNYEEFVALHRRERGFLEQLDARIVTEADQGRKKRQLASRAKLLERLEAIAAVRSRLLAWAGFQDLDASFQVARKKMLVAAAVAAIGIVGFHLAANQVNEGRLLDHAVTVHLTDAGEKSVRPLLGPDCPLSFSGTLEQGTAAGPWLVEVTEADCTRGMINLAPTDAAVFFDSAEV